MTASSPVIIALDYPDKTSALNMAARLDPEICRVKVGKELFTSAGPSVVEALTHKGFDVFLDLKFHDIPSTTAKAVRAAAESGAWMVNVHACGGQRMMTACREILEQTCQGKRPILIGVTVLTSMTEAELQETGITGSMRDQIHHLAKLAENSGLDGVVCPAGEAPGIRQICNPSFVLVSPGIRPEAYKKQDDQRQIVTPEQAITMGVDYLVIGRPVTQSETPNETVLSIIKTLS